MTLHGVFPAAPDRWMMFCIPTNETVPVTNMMCALGIGHLRICPGSCIYISVPVVCNDPGDLRVIAETVEPAEIVETVEPAEIVETAEGLQSDETRFVKNIRRKPGGRWARIIEDIKKWVQGVDPSQIKKIMKDIQEDPARAAVNARSSTVMKIMVQSAPVSFVDFFVAKLVSSAETIAMDESGSRLLQRLIENPCPRAAPARHALIRNLLSCCCRIAMNHTGIYVALKLLEHASESERSEVAEILIKNMRSVAVHESGVRFIMKALRLICETDRISAVNELLDDPGLGAHTLAQVPLGVQLLRTILNFGEDYVKRVQDQLNMTTGYTYEVANLILDIQCILSTSSKINA